MDNGDIAVRNMEQDNDLRERRIREGYPVAVAWVSSAAGVEPPVIRAVMIPDRTTVSQAKYEFLANEKNIDVADDPWAVAYRDENGDPKVSGWPDLKAKAEAVFLEYEDKVPFPG